MTTQIETPSFTPPRDLLTELEPAAEMLLNRHLGMAKEWFPHDYIPYSMGRDFDKDPWTPDQPRISGVAQIAFEVNLLTEDNLPSYHREIHRMFGRGDGPWINWVNRWTAEEGRHAIVLRDYLVVTRNIDPIALERGRMNQLQTAYDHDDGGNVLRGLAYVAFQELATRISHRNTGRYSSDPVADRIMTRIASDENLHMVFYRDMLSEAMKIDPSAAVHAIADEIMDFQMPGVRDGELHPQGRPDGEGRHLRPARPSRRRHLAAPAHWGVFERRGHRPDRPSGDAPSFAHSSTNLDAQASRFEAKRAQILEREAARAR